MVAVKVNITKYFIKKGERGNPRSCPVALALYKIGVKKATVFGDLLYVPVGNFFDERISVGLPKSVERFVGNFDDGNKVKPFSFVLRVSNKTAKTIGLIK